MGSDSWGLVVSAVVTGVFGVVLIMMQRNTHNEIKSPNGTKTGATLYEMKLEQQNIKAELASVKHMGMATAQSNRDLRKVVNGLVDAEAAAHVREQEDRDLKAAETAARQQEIVAEVRAVAPEAERNTLPK